MSEYKAYELFTLTYKRKDNGQTITRIIVPVSRANSKDVFKVSKKGNKLLMCARFRTWNDAERYLAKDLAIVKYEKENKIKQKHTTVSLTSLGKYFNSIYRDSFRNYIAQNIISVNRIILNPSTMDKVKMMAQDMLNNFKKGLNRFNPFKTNKYKDMEQGNFNVLHDKTKLPKSP